MGTLIQDLRYGLRALSKSPGFTVVAVLALALGVGANSAIFSVVNAVLLRPLPFPEEGQLLRLGEGTRGQALPERGEFSFPDYRDVRAQAQTLSHVAVFLNSGTVLRGDGLDEEQVYGADVTPEYFAVLGTQPELGRVLTDDDNHQNADAVVISHGLWQRRFGGRRDVIGQPLKMGGSTMTVVGVMPAGYEYPFRATRQDFWEPLDDRPDPAREQRDNHSYNVIARTKPGVTVEQANADLDTISRRLEQQYPDSNTTVLAAGAPMRDDVTRDVRPALLILLGAVLFVLLIACANVANLTLARATTRRKEIAVRTALGASRWRIVRQLLVESLLLSLAGGAAGLLLAMWGADVLVAAGPADIPRVEQVGLDARVVAFTFLVSALTGVLFGLVPALTASKAELTGALKEGARGTTEGLRRNRLRSLLVVSEVALSLVLLIGAGLLIRSFVRLLQTDPGFDASRVVALDIPLGRQQYGTPEKQAAFFDQLVERVRRLPGVEAVGVVNNVPLGHQIDELAFNIGGRQPFPPGDQAQAHATIVSPGYFDALRIPLREGRAFSQHDGANTPRVMLVSEALARKYFAGERAVGQRLVVEHDAPLGNVTYEIVGVVGDARRRSLEEAAEPEFYVLNDQLPQRRLNLVVRTSASDPASLTGALRGAVAELDKGQIIWQTRTLDQLVSASVARRRFNMTLLGVFAAVALLLAALGIYGVMAYSVTRRTHEVGVRMALGAQRGDVLRMIVGQGMTLACAGVAVGLAAAFAVTRVLSGLLYGVTATDPLTYAGLALLLAAIAFVSCYLPARRATKVDPMVALRYE
ncbi:MAG TPA: ABC transporter permease [Pyrinomonadaceae bacterium]|nr:ABC transporter permease [Pyrinomonadaceae bacterium]